MLQPLTQEQNHWVEKTLSSMSIQESVGHLLCPEDRSYKAEDWSRIVKKIPLGSAFISDGGNIEHKANVIEKIKAIQENSRIPVIIAADMEEGSVGCESERTLFPHSMACAATRSPELLRAMGRAKAIEARASGVHWTFTPVADLLLNFKNHVTNVRSMGSDPAETIPLLVNLIQGLQEDCRIAATAKHFPGDGVDERDQHLCTTVNSLPFEQWMELYGRVWKSLIDSGVMTIMSGHISLPDWQGFRNDPEAALPATLCSKLQIELLRGELGFKGLIVSDAVSMIGITSRVDENELAWRNIAAGSDVVLFANPEKDFSNIMDALKSKKLSEERVFDAARRVLELKARLNIHRNLAAPEPDAEEMKKHSAIALEIAERSITQIRKKTGLLPLNLKPGDRVFTYTITVKNDKDEPKKELDVIDEELRARGLLVEHAVVPERATLIKALENPDIKMVFVNFLVATHMEIGRIMMCGKEITIFWRTFYRRFPDKVVFTSFANPFILYEQPHINNLLLTYSFSPVSQRAAVKTWLGEIEARGICPVKPVYVKVKNFDS